MKKYFKYIIASLIAVTSILSCEDREIIQIDQTAAPMVMDLSKNEVILDGNFPDNPALTITWDAAQFTVPTEVNYIIQASKTEDFKDPSLLGVLENSTRVLTLTTKQLNDVAKNFGFSAGVQSIMYIRVSSYIGMNQNSLASVSNVTSLKIVPYKSSPVYPYTDLYLVGDATAAGWDNLANNASMFPLLKTTDASKYTFTGYFKEGGFKMVKVKGDWAAQYGLGSSAGQLSTDGGSGDIKVLTAGYYKLTIDISALTYTLESVTDSGTTYNSISIIGSVNGDWNTDTELVKSSFDPHTWIGTKIVLKDGEFKFRANNAWDNSWGAATEFFGTATLGGANIPLSAEWTYDVYFNDSTGHYTLIPTE